MNNKLISQRDLNYRLKENNLNPKFEKRNTPDKLDGEEKDEQYRNPRNNLFEVIVSNRIPVDHLSINVVIPAQLATVINNQTFVGNYVQLFGNANLSLPDSKFYDRYISGVRVVFDTAGIWNIPRAETVSIITNAGGATNVVHIGGGYFDIAKILQLCVTTTMTEAFSIPTTGANSFLVSVNAGITVNFTNAPVFKKILGYLGFNNIINGDLASPSPFADQIIDITNGYEVLYISNDLIVQSTTVSQTYIIAVPVTVPIGQIQTAQTPSLFLPIKPEYNALSQINWKFVKADGTPYGIGTAINVFLDISIVRKRE